MILRIVRGRILPGRNELLRAGLVTSFAAARQLPGLIRLHMALGSGDEGDEGAEFAAISTWTTPDAAMAVFGRNVDRIPATPNVTEHLDVRDIAHFELDESRVVGSDRPPILVRLGVGSIELGRDAEIQQELRRRLPELGDEVAEAYVGRRIRDNLVEVAFVTLWSRRPADRSLADPLWPDVADRYSSYWIEVYDQVMSA